MELAHQRYLLLTTFRRDGSAASTPVWVVSDDGVRLLVWTGESTWKAKRIRRNPSVRVAPSDARGRPQGEAVEGTASLVDEVPLVERLLVRKYGWQMRGLTAFNGLLRRVRRRPPARSVAIEIRVQPRSIDRQMGSPSR